MSHRGSVVLEIGPGGGRWTRYMLGARHIYVVDYHQELLDELARSFGGDGLTMIRNNGSDFPGVPPASVDFLFSFGCFVHLDFDIIDSYLRNMAEILKPDAVAVLQYSDKTKELARRIPGFADNDPERMRRGVEGAATRSTRRTRPRSATAPSSASACPPPTRPPARTGASAPTSRRRSSACGR
jgi:SAM-dependent methyltransferase